VLSDLKQKHICECALLYPRRRRTAYQLLFLYIIIY